MYKHQFIFRGLHVLPGLKKSYHFNIITISNAYCFNNFAGNKPMSEVRRGENGDKKTGTHWKWSLLSWIQMDRSRDTGIGGKILGNKLEWDKI